MVLQDQTSGPQSSTFLPSGNDVLVDTSASVHSVAGENHVPKIRKSYTITKQRERWTEEEHNKFLEALKLYGRTWRKIEEHIGTKTAVQIRSHAQKFFSKVVRETSSSNSSSFDPIEIPPPRPKRKPVHPYPRKLAPPTRKEFPVEQRARSTSPYSSLSEQENQSPTSVLSPVIVDTQGSGDSTTPDDSLSPISSSGVVDNKARFFSWEDSPTQDDGNLPVKLELLPNIDAFDKEDSVATKVLKLFGKDVIVLDRPSDSDIAMGSCENSGNQFDGRVCSKDGNAFQVERPIPLHWWVLNGKPIPLFGCHTMNAQDKEIQGEGSCAGSNSGSVNGEGNEDMNLDVETQSIQRNAEEGSLFFKKRSGIDKSMKGFVPYKRCLVGSDLQSSITTSDDMESQSIRLCL